MEPQSLVAHSHLVITAYLFDAKGKDREVDVSKGRLPRLGRNQLLWIDIVGREPGDLECLAKLLKLDSRALGKPAVGAHPQLSNYGDYFHARVVAASASDDGDGDLLGAAKGIILDVLAGPEWLVTIADTKLSFLEEFRDKDRGETIIGVLSSASLAASLLDWCLTSYHSGLDQLERYLDALDVRLLGGRGVTDEAFRQLVSARQTIAHLRRSLAPQRSVFYGLSRPDFALVTAADAREAFKQVERHFERLLDGIELCRENIQGSFELLSARIAESTNMLVRRLTLLSLILGGIGAVAGIFGMNFQTPYTNSGVIGFWIVIGCLLVSIASLLAISRLKRWI